MSVITSQQEVLGELVEVMLAGGADNLKTLLATDIAFLNTRVVEADGSDSPDNGPLIVVGVEFTETLEGKTLLTLTPDEAKAIVKLMTAGMEVEEDDLLGELGLSAIGEAMNQLMAGFGTSLGTRIGEVVHINPPTIELVESGSDRISLGDGTTTVGFDMSISEVTQGSLYWAMPDEFAASLTMCAQQHQPDVQESRKIQALTPQPVDNLALCDRSQKSNSTRS